MWEETEREREKHSVAISVGFTLFTSCSSCFATLAWCGLIIRAHLRNVSVHACLCVWTRVREEDVSDAIMHSLSRHFLHSNTQGCRVAVWQSELCYLSKRNASACSQLHRLSNWFLIFLLGLSCMFGSDLQRQLHGKWTVRLWKLSDLKLNASLLNVALADLPVEQREELVQLRPWYCSHRHEFNV